MGNGLPEYLLIFRKPQSDRSNGYADTPVVKDKPSRGRSRPARSSSGTRATSSNR
jgi:hypothetical protein